MKAAEPARASLRNGTVTLDQIHVVGQDTDLLAYGTAVVFGDPNPQGGRIAMHANGSVSMALASTFDPDLITSGKVTFNVAADGRMKKPTLTGNVLFQNVNLSIEGVAEWAEQSERDAGVQRRPAGRAEHDGDDGRRAVEDWRLPGVSEGAVCGPDGDGRCGAGALQRVERDGECELPAAGTAAVDAAVGQCAGDAIWGGRGRGLCGAVGCGRRAGAAGSGLAR